ncbi:transcription termination/antitermination protein NusG [Candidatus Riflebacteria bacterium]
MAKDDRDRGAWYVVHVQSGGENKVKANLEQRIETLGLKDRIFEILVPVEEVSVAAGASRKKKTRNKKIYPGYILVSMEMDDTTWAAVRQTPGVTGFVGGGNKPTALDPKEVHQIMRQLGMGPTREISLAPVSFSIGQTVKLVDGPFSGFLCIVKDQDLEKRKAKVLLNIFGRDTAIEVDLNHLEADS